MRKFLIFSLLALQPLSARAYFELTKTGDKPREMNGIYYDKLKDFTKNWRLVTVRYRQDTNEQRLIYANDVAFKAMQDLKPDYPDGAMFGKVGFVTDVDPAFPSSRVPSGAKRVQFMVRDKKKYKESDGWGYALFDADGNLFDEDMKTKTSSCVACHRLVPERNFVFARQMLLNHDSISSPIAKGIAIEKLIEFAKADVKSAAPHVRELLKGFDYYSDMRGELQKHVFSGTLDEVVPFLSEKAKASNTPTCLVADDSNFTVVYTLRKHCQSQPQLEAYRVVIRFNSKVVRDSEVCL